MKLTPQTEWSEPFNGTCLAGYIDVSYAELVEAFGPPSGLHDNFKSDASWLLLAEDGTAVTIYNYKTGVNYCGAEGTPLEDERDWHVGGGQGQRCVDLVKAALFG